ncbi:MAG TPA: hypothetical protein VLD37_03980 [Candidatus Bilamarchaeum sp.]|nr:hypothetical protein [Candidatus Bilamarchaeum sp.]
MGEVKETEAALVIAAVVVFALLACGAVSLIALFFLPSSAPQVQNPPPATGNQTGNGTIVPVPPETTDYDLAIWSKINKGTVESVCLQKAKEEAGQQASLVYSCDCGETVQPNLKAYRCDISTADPFTAFFANIDCYLERKECDVETNYGFQKVNFTQLSELE